MIEANEDIDLVTMRRQQEMRQAQESYQKAVSEGRLAVVSPRTESSAQLAVAPAAAVEVQPAKAPADPESAWRHTRLAITAGLVLVLIAVWIWQKRSGR